MTQAIKPNYESRLYNIPFNAVRFLDDLSVQTNLSIPETRIRTTHNLANDITLQTEPMVFEVPALSPGAVTVTAVIIPDIIPVHMRPPVEVQTLATFLVGPENRIGMLYIEANGTVQLYGIAAIDPNYVAGLHALGWVEGDAITIKPAMITYNHVI